MSNRIDERLRGLKRAGRTALVPFVTIGFPDVSTSERLARVILDSGGDMLELGIPFSDPLAEGPTIQKTSFQALEQGVNVSTALDVARRLRQSGVEAPLILLGYFNPYLRYGLELLAEDAAAAGLDGMIVPDLPPEESGEFKALCDRSGLHLIPLLAPTSTDARIEMACQGAGGFIYCVSLTGVTGARRDLASDLPQLVARIRRRTDLPVLVGFGVSTREHVNAIGRYADGAVVGSALLDAVASVPKEEALERAREFIIGLKSPEG